MATKKSLYHVAINSQGYTLVGSPERPARIMREAQKIGEMPSNTDLEYSEASPLWLPWAQTDFSGGFQSEKWKDDARFREGTNIDPLKKYGEVSLLKAVTSVKTDFADGHTFGSAKVWNNLLMVGTLHATLAQLWSLNSSDTAAQITTGWTNINQVNDIDVYKEKLIMALKRASGSEYTIQTWDGSSMANVRDTSTTVRMVKVVGDRIYASELNSSTNGDRLIFSDDGGTTWETIITKTGQNRQIYKGVDSVGTLYFLMVDGTKVELWQVIDTFPEMIYAWDYLASPKIGKYSGSVFVSGKNEVGDVMVFEWTGALLKTSFRQTITNSSIGTGEFVEYKNDLHLQGLIYDGAFWLPGFQQSISGGSALTPFASFGSTSDGRLYFYGTDSGSDLEVYKIGTTYVTTGTMTIGNFFGNKPSIQKLFEKLSANFKTLAAGESIKFEYSTDDGATYTSLGDIGYATYGAINNWVYSLSNVKTNKLLLRVTLTAGTSQATTPTLYDFVAQYRPVGEDKHSWSLTLQCSDNIQLLDKESKEPKKGVELRNLLRVAAWNNQIVDFEDVDYAETTISGGTLSVSNATITVDSTSGFPEQGRLRCENEEIVYTGKTQTTFTGCTRGSRGTKAVSHSNATAINTMYRVFINGYQEQLLVSNSAKSEETRVSISLIEA